MFTQILIQIDYSDRFFTQIENFYRAALTQRHPQHIGGVYRAYHNPLWSAKSTYHKLKQTNVHP